MDCALGKTVGVVEIEVGSSGGFGVKQDDVVNWIGGVGIYGCVARSECVARSKPVKRDKGRGGGWGNVFLGRGFVGQGEG